MLIQRLLSAFALLSVIAIGMDSARGQDIELPGLTDAEFAALEETNLDSVTATISFLASDELGGRGTPSPGLTIASAYVASRLRAIGAEGLGPDGSFYLEYDFSADDGEVEKVRNVIGVLRGSDPELANEAIIFSAHLDHLGIIPGGEDPIYNGADDDATGVTAVLTLADTYAALEQRPARSLIFMTFWGEEKGLLGSREFVEDSPWPLEKVVANINLEMLGRPEEGARNKTWVTGWNQSDLGSLVNLGSRRVGVETFEHLSFSARLYRASDNFAFVRKGVIAHSFSAGSLHEDYHQPSDEWEKLDLAHMTQVIRGLFAGTLPIAKGTLTPQAAEED